MSVLVTGGAGYIGSHMVAKLLEKNEDVIIFDNLQKGHKQAVLGGRFYIGDIRDEEALDKVFRENEIESVIHFAAESLVGESVVNPIRYYHNNVFGTLCLIKKMNDYKIDKLIFSSTAATYGEPENIPIVESDRTLPTNPYGETKLTIEKMLKWCNEAYEIKYTALRYFNAAGAHVSGKIGEDHRPESHLIPIVLQVALKKREYIQIFGNDYDTEDGTCIRDYIHVSDLASAHYLALERLRNGDNSTVYNLGNGKGFSVKEVVEAARQVTGYNIPSKVTPRRAGDPAVLVASSKKIIEELNWEPKFDDLNAIIATAWQWQKKHPEGFEE